MKLNVGDKVMLKEDSRFNNGSLCNPLNTLGIVCEITDSYQDINFFVEWDNGKTNSYTYDCLYTISDIRHKRIVDLIG